MSENYIQKIAEDKVYPIIRCKDAEQKRNYSNDLVFKIHSYALLLIS